MSWRRDGTTVWAGSCLLSLPLSLRSLQTVRGARSRFSVRHQAALEVIFASQPQAPSTSSQQASSSRRERPSSSSSSSRPYTRFSVDDSQQSVPSSSSNPTPTPPSQPGSGRSAGVRVPRGFRGGASSIKPSTPHIFGTDCLYTFSHTRRTGSRLDFVHNHHLAGAGRLHPCHRRLGMALYVPPSRPS